MTTPDQEKGIHVLYLSLSDILKVNLSFADAVSIIEASLTEHGEKQVENPPKLPIHPLPEKPHAETGEIVAGLRPGRENKEERIVNFNKGMAIHDILMAKEIYTKAKELGLGSRLTVQEPEEKLPMLDI